MKTFLTPIILLFCITITAQDKIHIHTATSLNSSGNFTYIDHPDLNGNPSAGIVISHVWNPGGFSGTYNNRVSGLWYINNRWAIYNENLSPMIIGSSYNVYIADPTNVLTHIVTTANRPIPYVTVIDDARFNNLNPGPYAVMSNYYNPNSVYNNSNYGFYYDTGINRRTIIEEGTNTIHLGTAYKILIAGTGAGVSRFEHQTTAGNISGNFTTLDYVLLNNNPDATFVFSHYYGSYGASSNVYLDKVLGAFYNSGNGRWSIYTEDTSAMPIGVVFDIFIAPNDNLMTYVPDDNFEQALIDLGYDAVLDDYVFTSNINTITNLNVSGRNIADLTGIEDFVALQVLDCYNNLLTSLDVSQNLALTGLYCYVNQLASLDLNLNTALQTLICSSNQLTSLDLTQNTALTSLSCGNNSLINLDLTLNTALTELWCYDNQLTSLSLRNGNNALIVQYNSTNNPSLSCIEVDNPTWSTTNWTNIDSQSFFSTNCSLTYVPDDNFEQALIDLGYDSGVLDDYVITDNINALTYLDVSFENITDLTGIEDFDALQILICNNNQLTSLNITQNTDLTGLIVYNNLLTSLDVSQNLLLDEFGCSNNQLTSIDVSLNTSLGTLFCDNNQITDLNLSLNTSLTRLRAYNNQLTNLNVRNGNNTAINNVWFDTTNNPNLTCIEVDDEVWSTINWTNIDATSTFVETQAQCVALSIVDTTFETQLNLYPNPVKNTFNIQNNSNYSIDTINIYTILGKLVLTINHTNSPINVSKLNSGMYLVKINSKSKTAIQKIIINK